MLIAQPGTNSCVNADGSSENTNNTQLRSLAGQLTQDAADPAKARFQTSQLVSSPGMQTRASLPCKRRLGFFKYNKDCPLSVCIASVDASFLPQNMGCCTAALHDQKTLG